MSIVDFTPKILRAMRKYHGMNQVELANVLHVRQGTLSKIEGGKLELSALQWLNVTSKFSIDPYSIFSGRIDLPENILLEPEAKILAQEKVGNFKIPKKYSEFAGSTVRKLLPFLRYFEFHIGQSDYLRFLKSIGMDPDYFTILNLPLNMNFCLDLFSELRSRNMLGAAGIEQIFNITPALELHRKVLTQIKTTDNDVMNFKRFLKMVPDNYDADFLYNFVGKPNCFIEIRQAAHLKNFHVGEDFLEFQQNYSVANFNTLARAFNSTTQFTSEKKPEGWDIIFLNNT